MVGSRRAGRRYRPKPNDAYQDNGDRDYNMALYGL